METYLRKKLNAIMYKTIEPVVAYFAYNKNEAALKGYNLGLWAPTGYKWFAIDVDTMSSDEFGAIDEGRWR